MISGYSSWPVFSYKLRYIVGFWLVETAVSTNQKPTMYRNLYVNTGPGRACVKRLTCYWFWIKPWPCTDWHVVIGFRSNPTPALFSLEYQEDGSIALKASNDKYVSAKQNGPLYATATAVTNKESFYFSILNRPVMVLRGDHGFVGMKTPSNARIECNKHTHDIIFLEHEDGKGAGYFMKSRSNNAPHLLKNRYKLSLRKNIHFKSNYLDQ